MHDRVFLVCKIGDFGVFSLAGVTLNSPRTVLFGAKFYVTVPVDQSEQSS